ncbi:Hsp20/alpha crystallin family protein [Defluviimonas sp. WL0050]|uniref:Hsp20/alpha crystallin family protein n=1 Tax=Albidovulum litorale TaxID=2984134 RepID=A0ABT2ZSH4_9RHOB|nr:Hsp20/alpha crystallin family protein [Defluviimonas sp. WL0050]MCV2873706.1 Hsp20/alpha crystallin family protein [Defluviimonas sp. WL0050]
MKHRALPSRIEPAQDSPFFKSLHDEIERVFDRFGTGWPMSARDLWDRSEDSLMPALDIAETDTAIDISAEIPGVAEKDIDVSITDGVLTLKGEKSSDHEEKEENYHVVERRYGSFRRSVSLGFTPDEGKVQARFKDGVLKLHIDKPEGAASRTRKIKIGKS